MLCCSHARMCAVRAQLLKEHDHMASGVLSVHENLLEVLLEVQAYTEAQTLLGRYDGARRLCVHIHYRLLYSTHSQFTHCTDTVQYIGLRYLRLTLQCISSKKLASNHRNTAQVFLCCSCT